ncbi:MAG: endo-1,4-beta-xylanase [Pirellulales bacterium]
MGQLRFLVPNGHDQATDCLASCGYVAGFDGVPCRAGRRREGATLVIERAECDSARLQVLWNVPGRGPIVLSTATLMERARPYYLLLELARGTLGRMREFRAALEARGVPLPESAEEELHRAHARLAAAGCCESFAPNAGELAQEAIVRALQAGDALALAASTARAAKRQVPLSRGFRLSSSLPTAAQADALHALFDTAVVTFDWSQLEPQPGEFDGHSIDRQLQWCAEQGFRVMGGPLVELEAARLPGWLTAGPADQGHWLDRIEAYVGEAVERYRPQITAWKAVGRTTHTADLCGLGEEQKLRLGLRAFEIARQTAPEPASVSVVFDQPWGEFITWRPAKISPLYFADALVRADLGLSALELELNLGYHPGGTWPRDAVEFERHLDRWACMGLPLEVTLVAPSSDAIDDRASRQAEVIDLEAAGGTSPDAQADWIGRLVTALEARPEVRAIYYGQVDDAAPHEWPWGGLFDAEGRPKPVCDVLSRERVAK